MPSLSHVDHDLSTFRRPDPIRRGLATKMQFTVRLFGRRSVVQASMKEAPVSNYLTVTNTARSTINSAVLRSPQFYSTLSFPLLLHPIFSLFLSAFFFTSLPFFYHLKCCKKRMTRPITRQGSTTAVLIALINLKIVCIQFFKQRRRRGRYGFDVSLSRTRIHFDAFTHVDSFLAFYAIYKYMK